MKKRISLLFALVAAVSIFSYAQKNQNPASFHGAVPTRKSYNVLYALNKSDEKTIQMTFKYIHNAQEDPRLKDKLHIELLAFGDGTDIYLKTKHYDSLLLQLHNKGVLLAQCETTIKQRHISKEELWPFISYVPTANGEIIIRQSEGWAVIYP